MRQGDWDKFQSTGAIAYYLKYKQQTENESTQEETEHAENHNGASASCDENGRV